MRMTPPKNLLLKWLCEHFSLVFVMVLNHTFLKMSVNGTSSARQSSRNCRPNCVLPMDFFPDIKGLLSRMHRWRTAAADAAAAAFEEARIFPLCGSNSFPMHAWRFDPRFNVIRIFWTILVMFHGRLGRFEACYRSYGVVHVWLDDCWRVSGALSCVLLICSVRSEILQSPNPESESGNTVHAWTCIERYDFSFSVWNWSLLLAHPTYWHECVTSWNGQNSWCWFWVSKGLLRNQSLETILVCIVVLCFTHVNIFWIHMCDECKRSNAQHVCHTLWSILWLIVPVCLLTRECQVYQSVPNTSMSRQSASKLWKFPTVSSSSFFLNWWSSKHGLQSLLSCSTFLFANSQYLSTQSACPFQVVGPRDCFCVRFFLT